MFRIDEDIILNENDVVMIRKITETYVYSIEICFNKTFEIKNNSINRMIYSYDSEKERDFWFEKILEKLNL